MHWPHRMPPCAWTGVRNYQARNFMRDAMRVGDGVLFYHSSCAEPGIVGIARVASGAYPDPTQFDRKSPYYDPASKPAEPRWLLVDVQVLRKTRNLSLAELRASRRLAGPAGAEEGQPAVDHAGRAAALAGHPEETRGCRRRWLARHNSRLMHDPMDRGTRRLPTAAGR